MRISLTVATPADTADVVLDCDDETPVEAVASTLAGIVPGASGTFVTTVGPVDPTATVGTVGLLEGTRVGIGVSPESRPVPDTRGWQLHVVSGPDCGGVYSLPIGTHEIGRGVGIAIADNAMSRRHCRIVVDGGGATVEDLGSSNGSRLDGTELAPGQAVPIAIGQVLTIGDSQLIIRPAAPADGVTEAAEPGWLHFLRPPRLLPYRAPVKLEIPDPPRKPESRRFPMVMVIAPVIMGVVMCFAPIMFGSGPQPMFLLFTLMSPLMAGANYFGDRRDSAKRYAEEVAEYEAKLAAVQARLATSLEEEREQMRVDMADAAVTFQTATMPGRRLWERRRDDADFLLCRVGTADRGSTVQLTGRAAEDLGDKALHAVPVAFSLRDAGVVGVAGAPAVAGALTRWLIAQLTTFHPPRDLSMSLLTSSSSTDLSWVRWLPHFRTGSVEGPSALVGNDDQTATDQVAALVALVKERQDAQRENRGLDARSFPAHVLIVNGFRNFRSVPGLAQLLDDGPGVGVQVICVDEAERFLPDRCTATVVFPIDGTHGGTLRQTGQRDVPEVNLEGVGASWCEEIARSMAPLIDVTAEGGDSTLPDAVRLLDVMQMDPPDPTAIRARWALKPADTTMTIGAGMNGPFALDLAADGPHGLIAGMTGAGKTELLQTMLASLALANRPDSINFVLVDYKGDSAFKDCVNLPHTVGKVNDLDPHLVERALASLSAELKYREHFFAEAQVKDIEDYQLLKAKEPHRPSLPRLLLVIDEFAALVKELPDFVNGLVGIAQRGRSLGVHLLLATQRPGGVVSPEIRANTNMRLSLRVAEAAESTDVINSPDAARIAKSTPGRGYARLGEGALLPFQSGRVGGRRPGSKAVDLPAPFVARVAWNQLGYAAPQRPASKANEDVSDTDLASLVTAVCEASRLEGVPEQRRPWLPALPEVLLLDEVSDVPRGEQIVPLPYGLMDVPDRQLQVPATFDLAKDGHLLVVGRTQVGRSQVLRTLAAAVGRLNSPDDVHLYGLDCGNGALNPLVDLPHCGAVVQRTDPDRATRLLNRIGSEMDTRQRVFAQSGYADITEQRARAADPLPHLLLLLDRWEGFATTLAEIDNGTLNDAITRIIREGASLGIHLVITGDRTLANSRLASMTESKLALKMAEKMDYSLIGLTPRDIPDAMPPGRGYLGTGAEVQVALLDRDLSGQGQGRALSEIGARAAAECGSDGRSRPFHLDALPSRISLDDALALRRSVHPDPCAVVGVGGDDLTAFTPDFSRSPAFIVAGPGRSGRSTVLAAMARSWTATGGEVIALAPRAGALRDLGYAPGVLALLTDTTATVEDIEALVAGASAPVLIVIDNGEGMRDIPMGPYLAEVARGSFAGKVGLVLGGDADGICGGLSGWQVDAKRSRQGLLLSPQGIGDADLIGARLNRSALGGPVTPGLGWLHLGDGEAQRVALPVLE